MEAGEGGDNCRSQVGAGWTGDTSVIAVYFCPYCDVLCPLFEPATYYTAVIVASCTCSTRKKTNCVWWAG